MNFQNKYRLVLWKSYFDQGLGLTNYLKYVIGFFALASKDLTSTFIFVGIYLVFCLILGYCWFKYGWVQVQQEVSNNYNLFVKEMRKSVCRKI